MISKRAGIYAQGLFALAPEKTVLDQLQELSLALQAKEKEFFLSPLIPKKEKKQILTQSMKNLPSLIKNFLFILIDRKALSLLSEITKAFRELLNESLGQVEGEVFSKEPLSLEEKTQLEAALKPLFKKNLLLKQKTKPFIGGLYIKAGDYIFNDTIQFHLKKFQGG